jgi:hypothetical protein
LTGHESSTSQNIQHRRALKHTHRSGK